MEDQFLSMFDYVADQERQKNRQRQAEGIEVAKSQGIKFGKPKMEITHVHFEPVKRLQLVLHNSLPRASAFSLPSSL